jgi:hypothetical protein
MSCVYLVSNHIAHLSPLHLANLYVSTAKDRSDCESLANKLTNVKDLPTFCRQFAPVVQKLESKEASNAFDGMRPGSAASARAARSKGQEHHAQVQRRLTAGGTTGVRRFSKLDK